MKLTLKRITEGEEEVIIRCRSMDERIEAIAAVVQGTEEKLVNKIKRKIDTENLNNMLEVYKSRETASAHKKKDMLTVCGKGGAHEESIYGKRE